MGGVSVRALGLVAALLLIAADPARGADIEVTSTDDLVTDDGACSLREAVSSANADAASGSLAGECDSGAGADRIMVPSGNYVLELAGAGEDANATGDLDLSSELTLIGSGASTTTIDGNEIDRVFDVVGGSAVVAAVKITGGHSPDGADATEATPATPGESGGGIRARAPLTLTDALVVGNATGAGGAVETSQEPGSCDVDASADGGDGGGIAVEDTALISRTTVETNITGTGGSPTESGDCAIAGNSGSGGGIANDGGSLEIEASTIAMNETGPGGATESGHNGTNGPGGGINSRSGITQVANTTVFSNVTGGAPAEIPTYNQPAVGGGGIAAHGAGSLVLTHVTLAQNRVRPGLESVIYPSGWEADIDTGGGARNTLIVNTIHSGRSRVCRGFRSTGHTMTFAPVLGPPVSPVPDGCPGTTSIDPGLGPLQDNGGPTETMAIPANSVASDGVPVTGAGCLATDQRSVSRPQGAACDIGAFEAEVAPTGPVSEQPVEPTPGLIDTPTPKLTGGKKLDVKGRHAIVPLLCGGPGVCDGKVALRRVTREKARAGDDGPARPLGAGVYSIAAGQTAQVRVKLSRRAAKHIRREDNVAARLVIESSASGARSSRRVRLQAVRS